MEFFDIRRDHNRVLNINVRLKRAIQPLRLNELFEHAKLVGKLAVDVQRFNGANVSYMNDMGMPILKEIIVQK